ncbi:MAG TPA: hypothetical protein VK468_03420 [Pyrinomonadaceae bacterium]|nr:hypothetical protein [Pyrinomonadaceae bacterium]
MRQRERYSSGAKWESLVGYSRAVKVGDRIYVTGTTATGDDGEIVGVDDGYAQTATTMVEVSKLIDPRMFIEIEADAEL